MDSIEPGIEPGERVEVRYYGCASWVRGHVTGVFGGTCSVATEDDDLGEGDVMRVEPHMLRRQHQDMNTGDDPYYDQGYFLRGDYVECILENEHVWKRARVAQDEGEGKYSVRMEDGSDEHGVRGRRLRHLLRSGDGVDGKLDASEVFKRASVHRRERDGMYIVVEAGGDGARLHLHVRQLMPAGRHSVREVGRARRHQTLTALALTHTQERAKTGQGSYHTPSIAQLIPESEQLGAAMTAPPPRSRAPEQDDGSEGHGYGGDPSFKPTQHSIGCKCKVQRAVGGASGAGAAGSWVLGQVTGVDADDGTATVAYVDGTVDLSVPWRAIHVVRQPSPARKGVTRVSVIPPHDDDDDGDQQRRGGEYDGHTSAEGAAPIPVPTAPAGRPSGAFADRPGTARGGYDYDHDHDPRPVTKSSGTSVVPTTAGGAGAGGASSGSRDGYAGAPPLLSASVDFSTVSAGAVRLPCINDPSRSSDTTSIAPASPVVVGTPRSGQRLVFPTTPPHHTVGATTASSVTLGTGTGMVMGMGSTGQGVALPLGMCDHLNSASLRDVFDHLINDVGVRDPMLAFDVASIVVKEGAESWDDVLLLDEYVGTSPGDQSALKGYLVGLGVPLITAGKIVAHVAHVRSAGSQRDSSPPPL